MILDAPRYHDRVEAGQMLARKLAQYASRVDTLVLAVPPGGVPVAMEVASYLNAPLDAFLLRKLTHPGSPGYALGAIASGGVSVYDEAAIRTAGVTPLQLAEITARESAELERRQLLYRGSRPLPHIGGRVVILVSDGLDTCLCMHAAVIALHRQRPAWLVVAAPVGAIDACEELAQEVHEVVCPLRPEPFESVGLWYDHFGPHDDDEIRSTFRRTSGLSRV